MMKVLLLKSNMIIPGELWGEDPGEQRGEKLRPGGKEWDGVYDMISSSNRLNDREEQILECMQKTYFYLFIYKYCIINKS